MSQKRNGASGILPTWTGLSGNVIADEKLCNLTRLLLIFGGKKHLLNSDEKSIII
jgi:hypothetical protein